MKLKVGTKVILKSKQGSMEGLRRSSVYQIIKGRNQKYAYITRIRFDQYVVAESMNDSGDFYNEEDVEFCIQEERKDKLNKINQNK